MAQLVEHNLAKVGVAGSSPVVRSIAFPDRLGGPFSAKWPSGKAEACKAFTPGSNPGFASRQHPGAPAPVLFYICGHGSVGRAQPCQGWGRGFEPRCPLQTQQPDYYGSRAFSYPSLGLEPERERALSKRGAFVASWRGRRQATEAGADPRSGYADAPLSAPTILRGSNEPRFLLTLREPRAPHLAPQSSVAYIEYASLLFRGNLGHPEPARSYDPIRCQEPQWPRRPLAIGRRGLPLNPSRSAPGMSSTPSAQSHIRGYRSVGPQSSPSAGFP